MDEKPGARALVAMKELNKTIDVFKTPFAVEKKKRNAFKILTEEEYIEELGKIIQRDFFPDLEKLKAQNEYLEAVNNNDLVKLRKIFNKYSSKTPLSRNAASPATFDTPFSEPNATPKSATSSVRSHRSTLSTKSNKSIADKHSLDSFLSTYSSEDNNSFQEIIEAADKKLRDKFATLFGAEDKLYLEYNKNLDVPSISTQFNAIERPVTVNTWTYKNMNYIMYTPEGVELTKDEQLEMAKRKQEIRHSNTRLDGNPFDDRKNKETISDLAKTQAKTLVDKVGVDGKVIDLPNTPNIRGFAFVKSPSPCPGITDSPLMTWGEIEGSPFRLDGGDTPLRNTSAGPSFRIVETSKREALALQLAGNVTEVSRIKKAKAIEAAKRNIASPHIRNSLDRLANMSPAARRLASSKLGIRGTPISSTPSPTPRHSASNTSGLLTPKLFAQRKTPASDTSAGNTPQRNEARARSNTADLTDNLLDIPSKRLKAADFF